MTTRTKPTARRQQVTVERAGKEGSTYSMIIAANDTSRNPFDEIRLEGGQFENYLRNPVVLWGHDDHALPIGRTTKLTFDNGKLRADFEFLAGDPMAERVKNAWDAEYINAASIRFMPLEIDTSDRSKEYGVVSRWDLLEWSLVAIPADPDALRTAAARALNMPVELFRAEDDDMPPDVPETEDQPEDEEPTAEERLTALEEKEAALEEREAALEARVEALEGDEPEEDDTDDDGESGGEPDEDERELAADLESVLRDIRERSNVG